MSAHLFIVRLLKKFYQDDAFLLSAAIAWGVLFAVVPFLALGSVIALFWGDVLLDAYLRLLA